MQRKTLIALLASGLVLLGCDAANTPGGADAASASPVAMPAHDGPDSDEGLNAHDQNDVHAGHDGHEYPDAHAAPIRIDPDHVRWTTDAPLREGMRRMRDAIHALGDHASDHPDQELVLKAATEVDEAAAFMFANCQLEAEPDVALHGLLARLMAGAQALRQQPDDAAALAPMRAALLDYTRLFDDPAFFDRDRPNGGD